MPLVRVSPGMGSGDTTRAHSPDRIGVPAGLWADVVPVNMGIPSQLGPAQRQPAQRLIGAGVPRVDLATGSTHPLKVNPLAGCCDCVAHLATVPDTVFWGFVVALIRLSW